MNIQWGQDKWPLAQITKVPWDCSSARKNPACLASKRQEMKHIPGQMLTKSNGSSFLTDSTCFGTECQL